MGRKKCNYKDWENYGAENKHVRIFKGMIEHPAYIHLTDKAKSLYLLLKLQYDGKYNSGKYKTPDTVVCPYRDIERLLLIRKEDIRDVIEELEAFGFIKVESRNHIRDPNQYTFIEEWHKITEEQAKKLRGQIRKGKSELKSRKNKARKSLSANNSP